MMENKRHPAYRLAFVGVMAALVYVVTLFRFPLLGSKVHFANAMCLLSGLLLGGGYLLAGWHLGAALYMGCFAAATLAACAVLYLWLKKRGGAVLAAL